METAVPLDVRLSKVSFYAPDGRPLSNHSKHFIGVPQATASEETHRKPRAHKASGILVVGGVERPTVSSLIVTKCKRSHRGEPKTPNLFIRDRHRASAKKELFKPLVRSPSARRKGTPPSPELSTLKPVPNGELLCPY